jgi:hypothetical protein
VQWCTYHWIVEKINIEMVAVAVLEPMRKQSNLNITKITEQLFLYRPTHSPFYVVSVFRIEIFEGIIQVFVELLKRFVVLVLLNKRRLKMRFTQPNNSLRVFLDGYW